ncbi:MAG: hypothetical protein JO023_09065 [Chloroflexi bacterium]|nr:hypothetical protein [Chloroflexota bacterium]
MYLKCATAFAGAMLMAAVTALPSAASGDTLANARSATAIYTDPTAALAAEYTLLTDAADLARPQALVYEVQPSGRVQLGALEYVVFQSDWDAKHRGPPTLFGQTFMLTPADNRFGLPAFYSLHVWIWKHNPKGTFEMWNPEVHCGGGRDVAQSADAVPQAASTQPMSFTYMLDTEDEQARTE